MATTTRDETASLEADLLCRGHHFSFFQAMRLLLRAESDEEECGGKVKVRPALSLAFPPADIAAIEKSGQAYLLTATFLGLYGPASPLPTFYTEALLEEAAGGESVGRDFLDIFHQRLFALFHQSTLKYRFLFQIEELKRSEHLQDLLGLIGLGQPDLIRHLENPRLLLRHTGLLTQHPRSALGLQIFLKDALEAAVEIVPCVERWVGIPFDQQLCLGKANAMVGTDATLGAKVCDRTGKFRVRLGPLDAEAYRELLPGAKRRRLLELLVTVYLNDQFEWDLELVHQAVEAPAAMLGGSAGAALGWDSWLAPDPCSDDPSVLFVVTQR